MHPLSVKWPFASISHHVREDPYGPTLPKPEMTMTLSRSMTSYNWEIDSSRVCAPGSSGNSKRKLARKEGRMLALDGMREVYDGLFAQFYILLYLS